MGQIPRRANIVNITNSNPCVVTTEEEHGYSTFDFVRLTNLNGAMPIPNGSDPLNNYRFRIIITGVSSFALQDPITYDGIDSTNYTPYAHGGYCNLIEHNYVYYNDEE